MSDIREIVRARYGSAVKGVLEGKTATCCGSSAKAVDLQRIDPITRGLYGADEESQLPVEAVIASFGCGNPTALAELHPGETVLDLGSGGGIDVLLSARRVGPTGLAFGLDMTDEMLELANRNKAASGAENVRFLKGTIESIPLPDASVDVVISNCVINLSADKDQVLREAYRVLRPGGRFAVSDIVLTRELPDAARRSMELWTGCVAGALTESDYRAKLEGAGFADVGVEPTRVYTKADIVEMTSDTCCGGSSVPCDGLEGAVISAVIRANKRA
jgi:SAM-dependent methyltransferase